MADTCLDWLRRSTYPLQMILSIPVIAAGIWLCNSCAGFGIQWGFIILGVFMLLYGLLGCCVLMFKDNDEDVVTYFLSMFVLLLGMLGFIIFLFVITRYSPVPQQPNHPRAYSEYSLDRFSLWFRKRLSGFYQWEKIVRCLAPTNWCAHLDETYHSSQQLLSAHLTPLQSGCCMPPSKCGYTFVSPTKWTSAPSNQTNSDCDNWSNDTRKLCYYCDSCKAGLLATFTKRLNTANLILLITFLLSFVVFVFHCIYICKGRDE